MSISLFKNQQIIISKWTQFLYQHIFEHIPIGYVLQYQAVDQGTGAKTPPNRQPSDKINIFLHGLIPWIETNIECLSTMIPIMDQILQKYRVPLDGCTLLIKIEEANIPQKGTSPCPSLKPPTHIQRCMS
jgi:hypothetical protein